MGTQWLDALRPFTKLLAYHKHFTEELLKNANFLERQRENADV
jgi:hypothetical protein